jgi:parallel beta-helix repeat protein
MQLWNSRRIRKEKQELKREAVLGIMLTLLFMGILSLTFDIQPVEAPYPIIYIKADGSIDPSTANITSLDNVTYTFTADINASIVVEKNNTVVDGAGYTVQGIGSGNGIDLSYTNNVTLKNVEVTNFTHGIYLSHSSNNTVTGNTASSNSGNGIYLISSSNNTVTGNNVSSNGYDGIYLGSSSNNTVTGNTASNNDYGIYLFNSSDNAIYHNDFIDNTNQAFVTAGYMNIWDDGAGEGNYWSDYEERYPNATEIDGIWDTPYVIDENNQDNYPIVPEFPSFLILPLFMAATLLAVIIYRRKRSM